MHIRRAPARPARGNHYVWLVMGLALLVLASVAWKRSTATLNSPLLHRTSPNAPAGPNSWVDLHAEIQVLKGQRDAAQAQVKHLTEQLHSTGKLQIGNVEPVGSLLQTSAVDRHSPWYPSEERDRQSTNPQLVAILHKIAVNNEVAVAVSNRNLAGNDYMLQAWCGPRCRHNRCISACRVCYNYLLHSFHVDGLLMRCIPS
jgi:hypothetical protein